MGELALSEITKDDKHIKGTLACPSDGCVDMAFNLSDFEPAMCYTVVFKASSKFSGQSYISFGLAQIETNDLLTSASVIPLVSSPNYIQGSYRYSDNNLTWHPGTANVPASVTVSAGVLKVTLENVSLVQTLEFAQIFCEAYPS